MKLAIGILLTLASAAAFATGGGSDKGGNATANSTNANANTNVNTNTNVNANVNANINRNVNEQSQGQGQLQGQKQGQAQVQGQQQGQAQSNTAVGSGNTTTLTFEDKKQAVPAFAPAMNSTASCRVGVGVGVGAAIGGLSVGGAYKDEDCDAREKGRMLIEAARIAHSLGAPAQYAAALFQEGLALIRGAEKKSQAAPTGYAGEAGAY